MKGIPIDFAIAVLMFLLLSSCGNDEPANIVANFSIESEEIGVGQPIRFTNASEGNPNEFFWEFDGPETLFSTAENPEMIFTIGGVYTVSLTAGKKNVTDTKVANDALRVFFEVEAGFSVADTVVESGSQVEFIDISSGAPNWWEWTFNGGEPETSNEQNPTVIFSQPGFYDVELITENNIYSDQTVENNYLLVLPSDGLILNYEFDENLLDSSPNQNHATELGIMAYTFDRFFNTPGYSRESTSITISGSGRRVVIDPEVIDNVRTITFWVSSTARSTLGPWIPLLSRETGAENINEFVIGFTPIEGKKGTLLFRIYDDEGVNHDVFSQRNNWEYWDWHHIAAVIDPVEGMKLYVDGVLESEAQPYNNAIGASDVETIFGSWGNLLGNGWIDDFRIYDQALSEEEVNLLYADRMTNL